MSAAVIDFNRLERQFFRNLNSVVEPAVRCGIGSPRFTPLALIVLETTGFKSGLKRAMPLLSARVGSYRVVSTVRGNRSIWVKNLSKAPSVELFIGGRRRSAEALVLAPEGLAELPDDAPWLLRRLYGLLRPAVQQGMAFAILIPDS